MAVYNLGSINIDKVYRVPHLVGPGETLSATGYQEGLGGKGANMSVAAARAAARVVHIGAAGKDGAWAVERMLEYGVDTRHIAQTDTATGHANICVDDAGENTIVILPGANHEISEGMIGAALSEASAGDLFVTQNETSAQGPAVRMARTLGLRVVYAAAPFSVQAVQAVAGHLDLLILNEVEAAQYRDETGSDIGELPISDVIITLGAQGCTWISAEGAKGFPAEKVTPVDTTGAGDTFTGYLIAGLDRGMPMAQAIGIATRAAALMVTRVGTADVIPDLREVQEFPRA